MGPRVKSIATPQGCAARALPRVLLLAGGVLAATACAHVQGGVGAATAAGGRPESSTVEPQAAAAVVTPAIWHAQHATLFERSWGVDVVGVRRISSGQMLRFDYRILDPAKARVLQEKTVKPYLTDEATGTRLAVPALENVGELRQTAAPEAGRTYFMIFGNPGGLVQSGSRVSVAIGGFHADGLIVD